MITAASIVNEKITNRDFKAETLRSVNQHLRRSDHSAIHQAKLEEFNAGFRKQQPLEEISIQ